MRYIIATGEAAKILHRFGREVIETKSWQEAHLLAQECTKRTTGLQYSFEAQQALASSMLRIYFGTQLPSLEVQKAVEYYLEVLFRYNSYGAPNLKAEVLPLWAGYWSEEKISKTAKRIFDDCKKPRGISQQDWMNNFYKNKAVLSGEQTLSKEKTNEITHQLITQIHSFPKRTRPLMSIMPDTEEYKELYGYNADKLAMLALLADGSATKKSNK